MPTRAVGGWATFIPTAFAQPDHAAASKQGRLVADQMRGKLPKRATLMDGVEVQIAEGKQYLVGAIDRTSKFAAPNLVDKADRRTAWEFLDHLLEVVPNRIHTSLTELPMVAPIMVWMAPASGIAMCHVGGR